MLSKSLSTSKKYAALYAGEQPVGLMCQALYPLLLAHSDDFGRLEGDVFTIKNSVVPASNWSETQVESALTLLHQVRLVVWYDVEQALYLQIVDFDRHQVGLHKRTKSRFPRVPGNSRKARQLPLQLNRTELKGRELNRTTSSPADAGRTVPWSGDRPDENVGVITKIAHEVIDQLGPDHEDLNEAVKSLCATRRIEYDSMTVQKAIESAKVQRKVAS